MAWSVSRSSLLCCWVALGALTAAFDFYTGPFLQFPILFILPVALAAWFNGLAAGLFLAMALPATRAWFALAWWSEPWSLADTLLNAGVRVVVLGVVAVFVRQTAEHGRRLARRVRTMEGLLPICGRCKKIRDEGGAWRRLEDYISTRSEVTFSHGLCEECARLHFGELLAESPEEEGA